MGVPVPVLIQLKDQYGNNRASATKCAGNRLWGSSRQGRNNDVMRFQRKATNMRQNRPAGGILILRCMALVRLYCAKPKSDTSRPPCFSPHNKHLQEKANILSMSDTYNTICRSDSMQRRTSRLSRRKRCLTHFDELHALYQMSFRVSTGSKHLGRGREKDLVPTSR